MKTEKNIKYKGYVATILIEKDILSNRISIDASYLSVLMSIVINNDNNVEKYLKSIISNFKNYIDKIYIRAYNKTYMIKTNDNIILNVFKNYKQKINE